MIVLDTSVLIDALTGPRRSAPALRAALEAGHRIVLPALVLYEWLRGPRSAAELEAQEALFPVAESLPFDSEAAEVAARIYSSVDGPRGREIDIAIAACAIAGGGRVWTLNRADFEDLPGLELFGA